jgi:hypothetical protein
MDSEFWPVVMLAVSEHRFCYQEDSFCVCRYVLYGRPTILTAPPPYIRTFNNTLIGEFLLGKFSAVHIHELREVSRHLIHAGYVTVRTSRRLAPTLAASRKVNVFSFWIFLAPVPPEKRDE